MSFADAAERVLIDNNNQPLHYEELTRIALAKGYITTTGKTPGATMNSAIVVEMREPTARFIRVAPGTYRLQRPSTPSQPYNPPHVQPRPQPSYPMPATGKPQDIYRPPAPKKKIKPVDNVDSLLKHLQALDRSGQELERIIKAMLEKKTDYENPQLTDVTGDQGVDLTVNHKSGFTRAGTDKIIIQVKNYTKTPIGTPEIRNLLGTNIDYDRAWFITTSSFTKDVLNEYGASNKLRLTDGRQLAEMLIDSDISIRHIFPLDNSQNDA